jgi:hypothetical protein
VPNTRVYLQQNLGAPFFNPDGESYHAGLDHLVFHTSKGTAFISSIGWAEFGPITFVDQPWLEDVLIQWPIKMDITEADQLIKKAGHTGKYGVCVLRHPL